MTSVPQTIRRRGFWYVLLITGLAATSAARAADPAVVVADENSHLYAATWSAASNAFVNYTYVGTLRRTEGPAAYCRGVGLADFNGDGHDDIVTGRHLGYNAHLLVLWLNDGTNGFIRTSVVDVQGDGQSWLEDFAVGDFDNDGNLDFAAGGDSGSMGIYLGDGAGGFSSSLMGGLEYHSRGLDAGDFNHDGNLDLVRASFSSGNLMMLEGMGDGTFAAPVWLADVGTDPYGVTAGDFDNDGHLDVIADAGSGGDPSFLKGRGDGTFEAPVYIPSLDFNNHGSYDAYDYDGDGNLDVVASSYTSVALYYFAGNGDGTFDAAVTVGTTSWNCLAVAAPPLPPLPGTPLPAVAPASQTIATNGMANLDGSGSADPGGTIVSHSWTFGDGGAPVTNAGLPGLANHTYTNEDIYTAYLGVTDDDTNQAYAAAQVIVTGAPPTVSTSALLYGEADATGGAWPVTLAVSNLASDAEGLASWSWEVVDPLLDDFEDGDATGWHATDGSWSAFPTNALGGSYAYRQSNISRDRTRNYFATSMETDFAVETDFVLLGGTGEELMVLINGYGSFHFYELIFRGRGINDLRMDRILNGGHAILNNVPLPTALVPGQPHHIKIVRQYPFIHVHYDGEYLASAYDGSIVGGQIGLSTYRSDALFDDITVTRFGSGTTFSNTFSSGTHTVALAVADASGQPATGEIPLVMTAGAPPTANPGGPYSVDEFSGSALAGGWTVALDGSASSDAETATPDLIYRWDLGDGDFDGTNIDHQAWVTSAEGVSQDDALIVQGVNTWGIRYACSTDSYDAVAGLVVEARAKHSGGHAMIGLKNESVSYNFNQMPYAFYFAEGVLYVYESGVNRGQVGRYLYDTWFDVQIALKETVGATYSIRADGSNAWTRVYDSFYDPGLPRLRRGVDVHSGTLTVDSLENVVAGMAPNARFYGVGPRPVSLTVRDRSGGTHAATTTVTTVVNDPPVPDAGTNVVVVESNAVDGVWTVAFSATGSSDDHGIYTYEWDWDYDGTFDPSADTVAAPSHAWTSAGIYTVAVRVTDHVLQSGIDTMVVTVINGTPPVADPGGPYVFDEFSGNAGTGAWHVALDGTSSSDADSNLVQYEWNLGSDTFTGTVVNTEKWACSADDVTQSNRLSITGAGDWGQRYCFSRDTYPRSRGMAFEARVKLPNGHVMIGFKNTNNTYQYAQMPYAIYFNLGAVSIYEDGANRGQVSTYTPDTWYRVRIELKESAGARYFIQPDGAGSWTLLYDSNHSAVTDLRRGMDVHSGVFIVSDMEEIISGPTPAYRLYEGGPRTVTLTVWDQALNRHSDTTLLTTVPNDPPVADAGGDKMGNENTAVGGLWSFAFSAAGSSDDHGIYRYEWDWDYQAGNGFVPSGAEGVSAIHHFGADRLGTNTIAVRVTDHVLQQTVDTALVILEAGDPPVADAGPEITVEAGFPATLDGSGSTDDVAVARYLWDFGDGSSGGGVTPQHLYRTLGDYTVVLVVEDRIGLQSAPSTTMVHVVNSTAPTAEAGGPYDAGAGGPPAYFDGGGSVDGGDTNVAQGIAKYYWDVDITVDSDGDTTPDNDVDLVGRRPFHTYATAGTYTIRLTVEDGGGQSHSDTGIVQVATNLPPHVICVPLRGNPAARHQVIAGVETTLKGVVRDAGALTYQWDFGDGSAAEPEPPATVTDPYAIEATHTYTGSEGKPYTAALTVWDGQGLSSTDYYQLVISPSNLESQAEAAIEDGLWWLHKTQNKSAGHWTHPYGGYYGSAASAALQAFAINAHRPNGDSREDPYVETVRKGFDYLFSILRVNAITVQTAGDPDTNGNGIGIDITTDRPVYETGMAMDAIAASGDLLGVAATGPAQVKHEFYYDILTDMVDMYAWGQTDGGVQRGGWRYSWNSDGDNSACQWAAIGMIGARDSFGINIPAFVKAENQLWLDYTFNGSNFGYSSSSYFPWSWYSTTPSAMVQMALNGTSITNAMWRAAEDFIADNWPIESSASRLYYAYYAFAKAMRLANPHPVTVFTKTGLDWFNDPVDGLKKKVVDQQSADGHWDAYAQHSSGYYLGADLSTAWAISMLSPSLFVEPPVAVITAPSRWLYGVEITFHADRSYHVDPTRVIQRYQWDFDGDGTTDLDTSDPLDPNARWTYPDPNPGMGGDPPTPVSVRLRVTDDNQPAQSDEAFLALTVQESPLAPFADHGGPYEGTAGTPFVLDGGGSYDIDPGDGISGYQWDIDSDDVPDLVTNMPSADITYAVPGEYVLALRVADMGAFNGGTSLTSEWVYTTVSIEMNHPPSFVAGTNVVAAGGVYPRTLAGWATAISAGGGPGESAQVLTFVVSSNDMPALFNAGPVVSPNGDLSFTPTYSADDIATIALYLQDDLGAMSPEQIFTLAIAGDADGDGIWDAWEYDYFFTTTVADAVSDYDLDTFLDVHEYRAGTHPMDDQSLLRLMPPAGGGAGTNGPGLTVRWQSVTTRQYTVQCTTDLTDPGGFSNIVLHVPGESPHTTVVDTNAVGPGPYNYRVLVEGW